MSVSSLTKVVCRQLVQILIIGFCLVPVAVAQSAGPTPVGKSVSKYGLQFPITRYQPTGSGQAVIEIGGGYGTSEELVLETRVVSFVSNAYFSTRALFETLPFDQVLSFIAQSLENKDVSSARDAGIAVISYGDAGGSAVADFIDALPNGESELSFLKELLLFSAPSSGEGAATVAGSVPPMLLGKLIVKIGLQDLVWLREHVPTLIFTQAQSVRAVIRESMFTALKAQKLADARALQNLQQELFGVDDPEVKSFAILFEKLAMIVADDNFVETITDIAGRDADLRKYFGPLFLDSIHTRVSQLLKENQAEKALTLLAHIDRTRRTPRTHELVIEALGQLPLALVGSVFSEKKEVFDFITFIGGKDPEVRQAALDLLERAIYSEKDESNEKILTLFSLCNQLRPDPNVQNDALRITLLKYFLSQKQSEKASFIKTQIKTSIGWSSRLEIFSAWLQGIGGTAISLIFGFLATSVVGGLALNGWVSKSNKNSDQPRTSSKQETHPTTEDEEEASGESTGRPIFVTARISSNASASVSNNAGAAGTGLSNPGFAGQYIDALQAFNLPPDSTLKEIKSAFRKKMKGIHPDKQAQHHIETPDEFIRLKQIYERILDLRKRMDLEV